MSTPGDYIADWLFTLDIVTFALAFYYAQSLLRKASGYFAIYDILDGERVKVNTPITWVRLLIPIVLGASSAMAAHYIDRSAVTAGTMAMILGGLLVVWPPLVEPGMRPSWYSPDKSGALLLLYMLYVLSHGALGIAGAIVGLLVLQVSRSVTPEAVWTAMGALVLSAFGSFLKDAALYAVKRYVIRK